MDRDDLIRQLRKLPKGTKVGLTTDLGLNKILWTPLETGVVLYSVDKNNHLTSRSRRKRASLR